MTSPAPKIDNRTAQDIVDEAKRRIPELFPDWTDHNVSDPGVALVELFAWMTESLIYQVNQVPDRMYLKFLDFLGITARPPTAARVELAYFLASSDVTSAAVPARSTVATPPGETGESVTFTTDEALVIPQSTLEACLTESGSEYNSELENLSDSAKSTSVFKTAQQGDAIYFGFDRSLAGGILELTIEAERSEGLAVDPSRPPIVWEVSGTTGAAGGSHWISARVPGPIQGRENWDTTGGFNRSGTIRVIIPRVHAEIPVGPERSPLFWVRCRIENQAGRPRYNASPVINSLTAAVIGGVVSAHHGEDHGRTDLGVANGSRDQEFQIPDSPVLPSDQNARLIVTDSEGQEEEWAEVKDFAASSAEDRHFSLEFGAGVVRFGPSVTHLDGSVADFGAIPSKNSTVAIAGYRIGGGASGTVPLGALTEMHSQIPTINSVHNFEPATPGANAETLEELKQRGRFELRTGDRAVTAADFTRLALAANPAVARAHTVPPSNRSEPVRIRIVPKLDGRPQRIDRSMVTPGADLIKVIENHLLERLTLGTLLEVTAVDFVDFQVVARIEVSSGNPENQALEAIHRYLDPWNGGDDETGWPFGTAISTRSIVDRLEQIDGVARANVRLFRVESDEVTGSKVYIRKQSVAGLDPDQLPLSSEHIVKAIEVSDRDDR